jgi:hypothetical protein
MKTHVRILVLASLVAAMSAGCSTTVTYVPVDPPTAKVEVRPAKPGAKHTWAAGHWHWNGNRYVWSNGHWMKNKKGKTWAPGHYKKAPHGNVWVEGYWN